MATNHSSLIFLSFFDIGEIMGKYQPKSVWLFVYGMTTRERPSLATCALSDVWEIRTQQEELPNAEKWVEFLLSTLGSRNLYAKADDFASIKY